ncbi:hypothetical protein [Vibrio nitrifigilis]|uniref:AMIN domain-containing protein n=1 Tax=Vibrio nitrifigilis TaxID=2789781 RepID=A0ABS0GFL0_9VIBR|nr:hypothetical protein [Vibrio nitrifigilis]MBF9001202.1 hypothetical protein [Vibrio nitrifigilis]
MKKFLRKIKRLLNGTIITSVSKSLDKLTTLTLDYKPDAYQYVLPNITFGYDRTKTIEIKSISKGELEVYNPENSWFSLELDINKFFKYEKILLSIDISTKKTLPVRIGIRSDGYSDAMYSKVLIFSEFKNKIDIPLDVQDYQSKKGTIILFFESKSFRFKFNKINIMSARCL